ncbi:hypothetical protein CEXT_4401 [Caerostris extrusa]|uniref:Uncharacterized protein n=1 Tax=Caerostris extrusa TaxID=172846 RepID=A0AAV4R3I4_CAEEX|nr:hypothetical protein CEXT_4401 [Caerostris extrusa]
MCKCSVKFLYGLLLLQITKIPAKLDQVHDIVNSYKVPNKQRRCKKILFGEPQTAKNIVERNLVIMALGENWIGLISILLFIRDIEKAPRFHFPLLPVSVFAPPSTPSCHELQVIQGSVNHPLNLDVPRHQRAEAQQQRYQQTECTNTFCKKVYEDPANNRQGPTDEDIKELPVNAAQFHLRLTNVFCVWQPLDGTSPGEEWHVRNALCHCDTS